MPTRTSHLTPQTAQRKGFAFWCSYCLIDVIGEGGMGVVYEAEDLLGRLFAVKMVRPEMLRHPGVLLRLRREATAMAQIDHQNVMPLHGYYEENGMAGLVMPLLVGETLSARLKRQGPSPLADLVRIGREAAEGLHAIHAQGFVHRDIKGGNLYLTAPSDEVVLMDMGLAIRTDESPLTASGYVVGTPSHISPERARGERGEAPCDVFALGVTLWEMATGSPACRPEGTTERAFLRDGCGWNVRRPCELRTELPAEMDALIVAMLARRPADRPTARQVAEAMAGLQPRPVVSAA